MKIISLILLVISLSCKTPVAQYDNPPQPILEEIREEEKEIFIGTLVTPPLPYLASSNDKSSNFSTQKSYSDKKLLSYIYSTLNYPDLARANQREGMVVVSFVIKKDG